MEAFKERVARFSEFDMRFVEVYVEPDYSTLGHYEEWEEIEAEYYSLSKSKDFLIEQYGDYLVKKEKYGNWLLTICLIPPGTEEG